MACTTSAHKFQTRLGFKQYVVLAREQSMLTKIVSSFEGETMQTQCYRIECYRIGSYRTDLYFDDYKLAIKIDENGHRDKNAE